MGALRVEPEELGLAVAPVGRRSAPMPGLLKSAGPER